MAVAAFTLFAAGAAQAAPGLQTFGTGDVTITGSDSATIDNEAGQYGGVYVNAKKVSGKALSAVDFSFTATGSIAGGASRFSIPIDDQAIPGTKDFTFDYGQGPVQDVAYAFLDVANCGSGTVSTQSETCPVILNAGGSWANWDAFAAANPTYRIASGYRAFVIRTRRARTTWTTSSCTRRLASVVRPTCWGVRRSASACWPTRRWAAAELGAAELSAAELRRNEGNDERSQ